ncbi:aquaporin-11-like [Ptychodera flava]|uniref:aquaporin-11-like n=1 Tax=Ptychodera flava TaxID=63121 RepID=UPI00396A2077
MLVLPTCPACVVFVALTTVLVYFLRALYRRVLPAKYHVYAAEMLSCFQLVAGVLEGDIIMDAYGIIGYAFYLFCLFVSFSLTFDGSASVCCVWEDMLARRTSLLAGHVKIACQLIGGLMAPTYVKKFWTLAMSETHLARSELLSLPCQSALKVSILPGMMAEMLATLISTLVIHVHFGGDRYAMYIESLVSVTIVVIGLEWTGMMFNPALATSLTYSCENQALVDHLLVYWFAPFLAVVAIWIMTPSSREEKSKKID